MRTYLIKIFPRGLLSTFPVYFQDPNRFDTGLEDASDTLIFEFAKKNHFAIVTFDSDFVDLNLLRGIPPKIIWLKTGNLTTKAVAELLTKILN